MFEYLLGEVAMMPSSKLMFGLILVGLNLTFCISLYIGRHFGVLLLQHFIVAYTLGEHRGEPRHVRMPCDSIPAPADGRTRRVFAAVAASA